MKSGNLFIRVLALLLAVVLSLPLVSTGVKAGDNKGNKDRVIIHIGTPAVWSLGQAHYLLAKMQRNNLELETNRPDKNALDPNAINATKIQILRTLLDMEAQFSEKIGVENRTALDEFKDKLNRRNEARADLERKQAELDDLDRDLRKLNTQLAQMETEYTQIKTERERPKPVPNDSSKNLPTLPPGDAENKLQQDVAVLKERIKGRDKERSKVADEVKALETKANADVSKPNLSEVSLGTGGSLPEASSFIKDRIKKVADGMSDPRFAASIALDNFIGMQYEIIAKQLTLLRDEVGPDERIVFLELPSSVYSVACKGDEHIAQVQWEVMQYYDDPTLNPNKTNGAKSAVPMALTEDEQNREPSGDYIKIRDEMVKQIDTDKNNAAKPQKNNPDTTKENEPAVSAWKGNWKEAKSSNVRAVDIIPRQSALNVNEVQSTVSQRNFLGVMKLLLGFGLRVNYQRQQELYEQYLQQEVFASGFGKGRNAFGWTFGPQPGTKRIAPGVRTTYAALVIPRTASLLRLKAVGVAFHRKEAPDLIDSAIPTYKHPSDHDVFEDEFAIIIPNENTEQFKINTMHYTPARKGESVSVVIKGSYFSPQAGILVDGVPLIKSLSLGNTATSSAISDQPGTGIRGQYELVSSRELVMKFAMPDNYVGTPNITLVTPEKSSALNFITMPINEHKPIMTLRDLVATEPMFMPAFSMQEKLFDLREDPEDSDYRLAILKGTGLRRRAEVWINGRKLYFFRRLEGESAAIREYFQKEFPATPVSDVGLQQLRDKIVDEYVARIFPNAPAEEKGKLKKRQSDMLQDDHKFFEAIRDRDVAKKRSVPGNKKTEERIFQEVTQELEKTTIPIGEYLEEQTTGEYKLRFLKNGTPESYNIRYRQNAIFNVEAADFTHNEPALESVTLMNYVPNYKDGQALVDVRIKSNRELTKARLSYEGSDNKKVLSLTPEGGKKYRLSFFLQAETESVPITVSPTSNFAESEIKTYDIALPLRPRVAKATLILAITGDGEGQVISLEGVNFQRIAKVKVGDKEADIIGAPEQGILLIKLPKGLTIKKDVSVQIPLVLETTDGTKVSVIATIGKQTDEPKK
jgi:hypothetical protein